MFRFHLPLIELDVRISRIQLSDGIRRRGPRHSHWSRMSSPSLWLVPRRPGPLMEVIGNMATLQTLAASRTLPKSGPFPPPELPGFHSTMSLSDSPRGPACPSRASGWKPCFAARLHRLGSPVLRRSSCSDMPSSLPRWDRRRLLLLAGEFCDRGLPHPFAGSAPTLPVSRPARRSLALRPVGSRSRPWRPFPPKASAAALPRTTAPIASGWSNPLPGGILTHGRPPPFTAHKGDADRC